MKKLAIIVSLFVSTVSLFAVSGSTTVVLPATGMTNLLSPLTGSAQITQFILTSPANNTASVKFVDSVTNALSYTNAAYIGVTTYATNVITLYTNFFGATNSFTNVALVDITNTVAAAIVSYPILVNATVATNTSGLFSDVTYNFRNGVWATNTGSGNATITVNYIK